ncbi:hypothetical protein EDC04DRAFT_2693017 [Pisolithus marmoratus]|nr:hypothetical protein EDC04DRAFT_2693017 [Pisolithus marmoratus]
MCLRLEKRIQHEIDSGKDMTKKMMYCRVLGYLFHHLPAPAVEGDLVRKIAEINFDDEKLLELGMQFYRNFIKPFMSNKGCPQTPPSRRSFYRVLDKITRVGIPHNHDTAKKHALTRDGFKCVVTKLYDGSAAWRKSELRSIIEEAKVRTAVTQCAHILPRSIMANIPSGSDEEKCATTVWAVPDHPHGLWEDLSGANIHRLENVMTMEPNLGYCFDMLKIWFVAMKEPNTYRLEAIGKYLIVGYPEYVTFSTPDPKKYPLPSPTYLAIHATCAKIANHSGVHAYIAEMSSRLEDDCVLAEDGGSADLLDEAILSYMSDAFPV